MGRKITVNMFMTLDGYGEFPDYPGSDLSRLNLMNSGKICGQTGMDWSTPSFMAQIHI